MQVCGCVYLVGFQGLEQDCFFLNSLKAFLLGVSIETRRKGLKDYFLCVILSMYPAQMLHQ